MDGALAAQIQAGKKLKKTQTNDRSTPIVPGAATRAAPALATAPRPPALKNSNGASNPSQNSFNSAQHAGSAAVGPPQLGGLFAGGMPTLKKTNTAPSASALKSAPPVPKPPTVVPPSRAPPPAPPAANSQAPPFRLPPPVPPQSTTTARPPPPPPALASATSSRPPPPPAPSHSHSKSHIFSSQSLQGPSIGSSEIPSRASLRSTKSIAVLQARPSPPPPSQLLVQQSSPASPLLRASSVGRQSQISSSKPPAPPPRPHTANATQPPPLPSRPGARAAPPPPPPRTINNSPNLGGSLNRKAPPPPPPRPSLTGTNKGAFSEIHTIERTASTPPALSKHASFLSNANTPSPPARLPPPPSRAQQALAPNTTSNATSRPMSMAPGLSQQRSPSSAVPDRLTNTASRSRVMSNPTAPEEAGISQSTVSHGSPRVRAKSMIVPGTLAPSSNRPPSPPLAFSINPPRNFPPSSTFPIPRKFQSGITHQYPSTKKQGCDWDYKAILT